MSLLDAMMTGLSGMNAGGALVNTAGSNLVNMYSANYKAARTNLVSGPGGGNNPGVQVTSITRDSSQGVMDETGQQLSNVDPANEVVHMMMGQDLYDASATLVRTANQMLGTLFDATSK